MITATLFKHPNGVQETITVNHINDDDAQYINENKIAISMEDAPSLGPVVYADIGKELEDGTPDEIIVLSKGRSCNETFVEVVERCKKKLLKEVEG